MCRGRWGPGNDRARKCPGQPRPQAPPPAPCAALQGWGGPVCLNLRAPGRNPGVRRTRVQARGLSGPPFLPLPGLSSPWGHLAEAGTGGTAQGHQHQGTWFPRPWHPRRIPSRRTSWICPSVWGTNEPASGPLSQHMCLKHTSLWGAGHILFSHKSCCHSILCL